MTPWRCGCRAREGAATQAHRPHAYWWRSIAFDRVFSLRSGRHAAFSRAYRAFNAALTFPLYKEAHPDCLDPDWDPRPVCLMPPCKPRHSRSPGAASFLAPTPLPGIAPAVAPAPLTLKRGEPSPGSRSALHLPHWLHSHRDRPEAGQMVRRRHRRQDDRVRRHVPGRP